MGLGGRVEVVMVNKYSKFGWNPFVVLKLLMFKKTLTFCGRVRRRGRRRRRRRRRQGEYNSPPYSSNSRAKNGFKYDVITKSLRIS